MPRYAENTTVNVDTTKREIESILQRYGATQFAYGWQQDAAMIAFTIACREVRIILPLPSPDEFDLTPTGKWRSESSGKAAYEQGVRQRWRALALVIKAKLEAVECGITTIEREFLSGIVLPDGSTVGDWAAPQIRHAYESGQMPALLPGMPLKQIASGEGRGRGVKKV